MPRTPRKAAPAEPPGPNSIIASAARVTSKRASGQAARLAGEAWQRETWEMLDGVGELEFYRSWIAGALSRVTLFVRDTDPATGRQTTLTSGPAYGVLGVLFGGEAGQSQMLSTMAGHLRLPGESWLFGLVEPSPDPDGPDQWRVLSRDELKQEGSRWLVDRGDGVVERYDDGTREGSRPQALAIRIWDPHPRMWVQANSSCRSALPILRRLRGYHEHIAATIDSRLAGAGVLVVPTEVSFTTPGGLNDQTAAADPLNDPFQSALIETMVAALSDRGSAAALAPVLMRVPAQYVKDVQHISFATPFAEKIDTLLERDIGRLATTLDVPKEVLLGLADVNHWTGWLLDENAIKMHVEPLVGLICHALTTKFLWPALQGDADTFDPALRRYTIEGDTSLLRQRPNHSAEAQTLHGDLRITDAALIRETGFEEGDMLIPATPEYRRRILEKIALSATTPEVAQAALEALELGVQVPQAPATMAPGPAPAALPGGPTPTEPTPTVDTREPPTMAASAADDDPRSVALLLGAEMCVLRAVERGWNRAGRRGRVRKPVAATDLDACLAGAWDHLPRVAALTGVDEAALTAAMDLYARGVLTTGAAHDPTQFARLLREQVLAPEAAGV